eukprot:3051106-Amphidinium_carterae.2
MSFLKLRLEKFLLMRSLQESVPPAEECNILYPCQGGADQEKDTALRSLPKKLCRHTSPRLGGKPNWV